MSIRLSEVDEVPRPAYAVIFDAARAAKGKWVEIRFELSIEGLWDGKQFAAAVERGEASDFEIVSRRSIDYIRLKS